MRVEFDEHAFKYFDSDVNKWASEPGEYSVLVGSSSRDIHLEATVYIDGEATETAATASCGGEKLPHYFNVDVQRIPNAEFEALLGRRLPPGERDKNEPLSYTDTIARCRHKKGFGRLLYRSLSLAQKFYRLTGKKIIADHLMFITSLRFNQLARMSGGKINMPMLDGLLIMVNGQFWKGFRHFRKAGGQKK